MGLIIKRDKGDGRTAMDVVRDVSHDVYHRVAKRDKASRDGHMHWQHAGECEWTRANS